MGGSQVLLDMSCRGGGRWEARARRLLWSGSGGDELVADAAFTDDLADVLRVALKLLAETPDVHLQVVDLIGVLASPDLRQQGVVGEYAARVAGEMEQQRILRGRQADEPTADGDLAARVVHSQLAGLEHLADRGELVLVASEHGTDPGQQLQVAERLGNVVVGAHLQASHLVHLAVAGADHDDGHVGDAAHFLADLEAVDAREDDIEKQQVRGVQLQQPEGLFARLGGGNIGLRPAQAEAEVYHLYDVGFVVDNEYFHGPPAPRAYRAAPFLSDR